jgi:hypothetical protein
VFIIQIFLLIVVVQGAAKQMQILAVVDVKIISVVKVQLLIVMMVLLDNYTYKILIL